MRASPAVLFLVVLIALASIRCATADIQVNEGIMFFSKNCVF
jgi:hypothetical protein